MRSGFTLIEMLVSMAIVVLLMALVIPAVFWTRESARRITCSANLRQIGVAIGNYASTHQVLPPGRSGRNFSLHVVLLPELDQASLYNTIDFSRTWEEQSDALLSQSLPVYLCPSDSAPKNVGTTRKYAATSYAGNYGSGVQRFNLNGAFQPVNSGTRGLKAGFVTLASVRDGLSNTAAVAEILHADGSWHRQRVAWNTPRQLTEPDELELFRQLCESLPSEPHDRGWLGDGWARGLPWMCGSYSMTFYNHVVTPNGPSCFNGTHLLTMAATAGSAHGGGVNVLYLDGRVSLLSDAVELQVWRDLGSRSQPLPALE